jgi:hemin uptake protein HemP
MQTMQSNRVPAHQAPPVALPAATHAAAAQMTTEELFAGAREIALLHNGRQYRLRITQQGKLLLTA